jgi:dihydropteroate synthase
VSRALSGRPEPLVAGPRTFAWGERTYVMGILNVTPDSFSGDGLLATSADDGRGAQGHVARAVERARAMADAGADVLDVGGESTRPGHEPVDEQDEADRVVPVVAALREHLPDMPISVDTTKPSVAEAALAAGAHMVNDVWGVSADDTLARIAAAHGVPIVLMHNRAEPRYTDLVAEVVADLEAAIQRALKAGVRWEQIVVDPGIGFGKTAEHNLVLLHDLAALRILGRPILLGTSRKSTIGKVLDLPADQRLEGTLATTALGIAAGVDMVRVHDVLANVRAARMADAIIRGTWRAPDAETEGGSP